MTITIEITDEQAEKIKDEAARYHISVEQLIAQRAVISGAERSERFQNIKQRVLSEDIELLRRLAS